MNVIILTSNERNKKVKTPFLTSLSTDNILKDLHLPFAYLADAWRIYFQNAAASIVLHRRGGNTHC